MADVKESTTNLSGGTDDMSSFYAEVGPLVHHFPLYYLNTVHTFFQKRFLPYKTVYELSTRMLPELENYIHGLSTTPTMSQLKETLRNWTNSLPTLPH